MVAGDHSWPTFLLLGMEAILSATPSSTSPRVNAMGDAARDPEAY